VSLTPSVERPRSLAPAALVIGSVAILGIGLASGVSAYATIALVVVVTCLAQVRTRHIPWPRLLAALIFVILLIPIRRYAFPGSLPFELEPYRVLVGLLVLAWLGSLLADPTTRLRRTGFEGPLVVIVGAAVASIVANPERVAQSGEVAKSLMFLLSFALVLYLICSVIRRIDTIDFVTKALVAGGAVVAFFAIVEARTGYNVFNHIDKVVPFLRLAEVSEPGQFLRYRSATLRVFGSAQHPIALSAAFVMLTPLAVYLAHRYRQRRWIVCAILLIAACAATVSRTGVVMLVVVGLVFLSLRPRETLRMWPALLVALILIKVTMPGTLGAIRQSFFPPGGLIAEQKVQPGEVGSGRLADLGPALRVWTQEQPLIGQGYGTYLMTHPRTVEENNAFILDNQWLGTLLATGAVGVFGWLWLFVRAVRRFGAEARRDHSERGWLLASLTAGICAFAVGMLTYDAFSFIQVTFLLFFFVGLGSALLAERPTPLAVREQRERAGVTPPLRGSPAAGDVA
jgi:O-antigen ligase